MLSDQYLSYRKPGQLTWTRNSPIHPLMWVFLIIPIPIELCSFSDQISCHHQEAAAITGWKASEEEDWEAWKAQKRKAGKAQEAEKTEEETTKWQSLGDSWGMAQMNPSLQICHIFTKPGRIYFETRCNSLFFNFSSDHLNRLQLYIIFRNPMILFLSLYCIYSEIFLFYS